MRQLMSLPQLANAINVSIEQSRWLRKRGQLPPAIKIGGALRFDPADVDKWIADHKENRNG